MKQVKMTVVLLATMASIMSFSSCAIANVDNELFDTSVNHSVGTNGSQNSDVVVEETEADEIQNDHTGFVLKSFEDGMSIPSSLKGMDGVQLHGIDTDFSYIVKEGWSDKKITAFGGDYTYSCSQTYWRGTSENEYGSFYCLYDEYKREDGAWLSYIGGTELLARYSNHVFDDAEPVSTPLSAEDATRIANEFLESILPEEVRANIPWKTTDEHRDLGVFYVGYCRYIHGYATDEDILVGVNSQYGLVEGYNGVCVGKYTTLESLLTKDILDKTAAKLEEKVLSLGLSELRLKEPALTTNTDGDVYMSLAFEFYNEKYEMTNMYQILCKVDLPAD